MWLNKEQITDPAIRHYRSKLTKSCPNYIVVDNLFDEVKLNEVIKVLTQPDYWNTQTHSYSELYVDPCKWHQVSDEERFVQRDSWQRPISNPISGANPAQDFLAFLRSIEFLSLLSKIFSVHLTDINVGEPEINTNFFRLSPDDFVSLHADDSPGREVCLLLYLNKTWNLEAGGELVFLGKDDKPVTIAPLYNRCVLFDPASEGSEHWVNKLNAEHALGYRYNVTSWYWSE